MRIRGTLVVQLLSYMTTYVIICDHVYDHLYAYSWYLGGANMVIHDHIYDHM